MPPDTLFVSSSSSGVGEYVRFCEVAFFHKKSRTLMVTDSVIYVPDDPPEVRHVY